MKKKKSGTSVLIFSGLTFEMAAIIGTGAFAGNYLDKRYDLSTPWFTVIFSLAGIALSFYFVFSQIHLWEKNKSS